MYIVDMPRLTRHGQRGAEEQTGNELGKKRSTASKEYSLWRKSRHLLGRPGNGEDHPGDSQGSGAQSTQSKETHRIRIDGGTNEGTV
jgi:hypothetical protein